MAVVKEKKKIPDYKYVIYEKEGNIARVIFNKPEKLNTYGFIGPGDDAKEIWAALDDAAQDDDIKVVILKGAGRAFCAGQDLTQVGFVYGIGTGQPGERRPSQRIRLKKDHDGLARLIDQLFLHPKITICQLHGYAVAAGFHLPMMCDLAVAAEDAQLGDMDQHLGLAGSGTPTIPIMIETLGLKRTLDLMLTGRIISGKEAAAIGLVNKAVPADQLDAEVEKMAKAICLLPRDGIAIGKAHRHLVYESRGLLAGSHQGVVMHTLFTNLRWEDDEYNFFRERREKGAKTAFHEMHNRYEGLV